MWNYWERDAPVKASDEKCKWLLLERDGKLMLLLCTWREKSSKVTLDLDLKRFDLSSPEAVDVEYPDRDRVIDDLAGAMEAGDGGPGLETAEPEKKLDWQRYDSRDWQGPIELDAETGELTVPLSAYGVRYVRIK